MISEVEEKHPKESEVVTDNDKALARQRDVVIFKKSDEIIDHEQFQKLIKFLYRLCFTKSQMNRIDYFIGFFDSEVNKYIDISLRYSNYKLIVKLKELFSFLEEYSVEYLWYGRLIEEGKLKGDYTRTWRHLDTLVQKQPDDDYLSTYDREEYYLLLPNPEAYCYFEIHYQNTDITEYHYPKGDFPESSPDWVAWYENLKFLILECKSAYDEYRSNVRDLLYL